MTRFAVVAAMALSTLVSASINIASGQGLPAAERFVLSGVVVFEGGSGLAWLQEPTLTGDRVVAVRPGESIGPYRLTRILDDRVELEGPGGTVLIPVYGGHGGSGTAIASTGPGGAGTQAGAAAPGRSGRSARSSAAVPSQIPLEQIANPQADPALAKALMDRMELLRNAGQEPSRTGQHQAAQGDPPAAAPIRTPGPGGVSNPPAGNPGSNATILLAPGDPLRRQTFQSFIGVN